MRERTDWGVVLRLLALMCVPVSGCFYLGARASLGPSVDTTGSAGIAGSVDLLVGLGAEASGFGVGFALGGAHSERAGGRGGYAGGFLLGLAVTDPHWALSASLVLPAIRSEGPGDVGAGLGGRINAGPAILVPTSETPALAIDFSLGADVTWIDQHGRGYFTFPLSVGLTFAPIPEDIMDAL